MNLFSNAVKPMFELAFLKTVEADSRGEVSNNNSVGNAADRWRSVVTYTARWCLISHIALFQGVRCQRLASGIQIEFEPEEG